MIHDYDSNGEPTSGTLYAAQDHFRGYCNGHGRVAYDAITALLRRRERQSSEADAARQQTDAYLRLERALQRVMPGDPDGVQWARHVADAVCGFVELRLRQERTAGREGGR